MSAADRRDGMTREQRTIAAGAIVVAVAVLINFGLVPRLRDWNVREQRLTAARAKLAEVSGFVGNQSQLNALIDAQEMQLAAQPRRVLRARSRALAASALQSLVQDLADASNVTVTRLDVANLETAGDLPITLAANGDIYGLANLLQQIRSARYAVVVDKLTSQNNTALRGAPDVLQITLSLHAPVIVE